MAIEIKDLCHIYGQDTIFEQYALKNVNITIGDGDGDVFQRLNSTVGGSKLFRYLFDLYHISLRKMILFFKGIQSGLLTAVEA